MQRMLGWLACAGAVVLLVVAMVTGTSPATAAGIGRRVTDAVVRLAVVPGRPAAGYVALTAGPGAVDLTAVISPPARVELHASTMAGGVMRMGGMAALHVPAGTTLRLAPGGLHLMIFDLPATVRAGGTLPLTFVFADGVRTTVAASVVASVAGAAPPHRGA